MVLLVEFMDDGKARALGVSNFDEGQLRSLLKTATHQPSLLQSKLSIVYHDDPVIDFCRQNGIVYQSYSPLCGGFNGSSCSRRGGSNVMTVPAVQAIAKAHDKSPAQIGLRWIVQQGLPLTTAVWDIEYMVQDLDIFDWNLTTSEMATLSAVRPYTPKPQPAPPAPPSKSPPAPAPASGDATIGIVAVVVVLVSMAVATVLAKQQRRGGAEKLQERLDSNLDRDFDGDVRSSGAE